MHYRNCRRESDEDQRSLAPPDLRNALLVLVAGYVKQSDPGEAEAATTRRISGLMLCLLFLYGWGSGSALAADLVCTSPIASRHPHRTTTSP